MIPGRRMTDRSSLNRILLIDKGLRRSEGLFVYKNLAKAGKEERISGKDETEKPGSE